MTPREIAELVALLFLLGAGVAVGAHAAEIVRSRITATVR